MMKKSSKLAFTGFSFVSAIALLFGGCTAQTEVQTIPSKTDTSTPSASPTISTSIPSTPAPKTEPKSALPPKKVANGGAIFKKMKGVYDLAGLATDTPVIRVIVPGDQWSKLSKSDQVNLTFFVQSLVSIVKANPEKYVDTPTTAPIYSRFVSKASTLCDDCWSLIVGKRKGQEVFTIDSIVVQGDTPWEKDDPCCRGEKASEFRQSTERKKP